MKHSTHAFDESNEFALSSVYPLNAGAGQMK